MASKFKSILVFLFALLFVLSVPLALAEDVAQESESEISLDPAITEEAGITAANPFWGLERAMEKMSLALTFSSTLKVKKGLRYANERLAEMQVLVAENKFKEIALAQQAYETEIETVVQEVETIDGGNAVDGAEDALEEVAEVQALLSLHYEMVGSVKHRIINRRSDALSETQITHVENIFSDIESKAQKAETQIETKRENVKLKYKVLSETTDGEVEKVEERIDERIRNRAEEKVETSDDKTEEVEIKDDEIKIKKESEDIKEEIKKRLN